MTTDDARQRVLALLEEPRLASEVPSDETPHLLAEVAALQGRLGSVQVGLLTRLLSAPRTADSTGAGPEDDDVLPVARVAEKLGKSEDTVRRMIERGELPKVPVGQRGVGVRRGAVREYVRKRERRTIGGH